MGLEKVVLASLGESTIAGLKCSTDIDVQILRKNNII